MWKVALAMVLGILMVACSEDEVLDTKMSRQLHLVLGTQNFTDVTDLTRGSFWEDEYSTYSEHYTSNGSSTLPTNARIQGFLVTSPDTDPLTPIITSPFSFTTDNTSNPPVRSWSSHITIDNPDQTYCLYGFMPSEVASGVTIAHLQGSIDYAQGAKLTINGINAVTPNDVCVIVGVKGYTKQNESDPLPSITNDGLAMNTRLGKFDIFDKDNNPPSEDNYAYLLVDHIFCGLEFKMKIDPTYFNLRTIKIKKVGLKSVSTDNSQIVKTVNVDVTLVAQDGGNPLSTEVGGGIVYTPVISVNPEDNVPTTIWEADEGLPLDPTTPKSFQGCFAPAYSQKFVLETTYDVWDKKNNVIRKDAVAQNTFTLPYQYRKAGMKYSYEIMVKPTYLYMLSEPDLDSPTFTIQ